MKVIVLNGPEGSGLEEASKFIADSFKFKEFALQAPAAAVGYTIASFLPEAVYNRNENAFNTILTMLRETFGYNVFAHMMHRTMNKGINAGVYKDIVGVVVLCEHRHDYHGIVDIYGKENVLLLQISKYHDPKGLSIAATPTIAEKFLNCIEGSSVNKIRNISTLLAFHLSLFESIATWLQSSTPQS